MIIVQFDDKYHHWAVLLLRSLQAHESCTPVFADTVNLSEAQVGELRRAHSRLEVKNDTTTWGETSPELMAARKPFVFLDAMDRFPAEPCYGMFDADFLVRRPLDRLWAMLDDHSAALFRTNGMWNGKHYRKLEIVSSIVLVTLAGRPLIEAWARISQREVPLGSISPGEWFWDQVTLVEAFEKSSVRCATLPMDKYADCTLHNEAAIWSAHIGKGKERYYDLFLKEFEKQMERVPDR